MAADRGYEACVRVLIAAKADMAYADRYGLTALHWAARNGRASTCRALIDEGSSLTAVNCSNLTPLELAKTRGEVKCVAILQSAAGASLDEHELIEERSSQEEQAAL